MHTQFLILIEFGWFRSRMRVVAELRHGDLFHSANIVSRYFNNAFLNSYNFRDVQFMYDIDSTF